MGRRPPGPPAPTLVSSLLRSPRPSSPLPLPAPAIRCRRSRRRSLRPTSSERPAPGWPPPAGSAACELAAPPQASSNERSSHATPRHGRPAARRRRPCYHSHRYEGCCPSPHVYPLHLPFSLVPRISFFVCAALPRCIVSSEPHRIQAPCRPTGHTTPRRQPTPNQTNPFPAGDRHSMLLKMLDDDVTYTCVIETKEKKPTSAPVPACPPLLPHIQFGRMCVLCTRTDGSDTVQAGIKRQASSSTPATRRGLS